MSLFGGAAWDESNVYDSVPFEEQLDAMDELRRSGKVRYFGLSNETSYGVMRFQQLHEASPATRPKMVSIQNSYSLLVRVPFETDLAETCHHAEVSLLAYSPLAGGSLLQLDASDPMADALEQTWRLLPELLAQNLDTQALEALQQAQVSRLHLHAI